MAHHADALSGMRSNLVDAFSAEQATDAATFGAAAWPALRAAGTALLDTASPQWLEVLAAHGPHATAGVATGPLEPKLANRILESPKSFPLQWLRVAEQSRSQISTDPPLCTVGDAWFDD